MSIADSNLWQRYAAELSRALKRADPTITQEEIDRQLQQIAMEVTVPIVNRETALQEVPDVRMTLYQAIDELEQSNDIISAAGTIVAQHEEDLSPFVNMIAQWKMERKTQKKKMFQAKDAGDEVAARYYDKTQKNLKSNKMNALYGILALVSSAFFNDYVPPAVTCSGRQLISNTAMMFESVLGNNLKFLSMGECISWIDHVCEYHKLDRVNEFVIRPDVDMVVERIISSFMNWQGDEYDYLKKYIQSLDRDQLTFVYYANNLVEFTSAHVEVTKLIRKIYEHLPKDLDIMDPDEKLFKKYGGEGEMNSSKWRKLLGKYLFLDPYHPPESIEKELAIYRGYVVKYVYAPFMQMSVVARLNKQTRKSVAVIDTDSNMIYTEKFTEFCRGIFSKVDVGIRSERTNEIISMMIIANICTPIILDMLKTVYSARRISQDYIDKVVLKNEWYYMTMLISLVKKRYGGLPMIQEGLVLPKIKPDIKGFDFKKVGIPKEIQERMIKILVEKILMPDQVKPNDVLEEINQMRREIEDSILRGETAYWKLSTFKDASAYQHPERIQSWNGGMLWNQLYPAEAIESLDKVYMAKLKKGAVIREVLCGNVIAVPMTLKQVPEEIISQLDVEQMADNIISAFSSVLDCFGFPKQKVKTAGGANIIKRTGVIET